MINFKKVKIRDYIKEHIDERKGYRNIERLRIDDDVDIETADYKTKVHCVNHIGKDVLKSVFMLKYGYKKHSNGLFFPLANKKVNAIQVHEPIEFTSTDGNRCLLLENDFIVMNMDDNRMEIFGMSLEDFETNYATIFKANDILKNAKKQNNPEF